MLEICVILLCYIYLCANEIMFIQYAKAYNIFEVILARTMFPFIDCLFEKHRQYCNQNDG